jgi:predicted permease
MLRVWLSRLLGTLRRRRLDVELDEELQAHLEMLQERFVERGMDPTEAFYAARRHFGELTQVKESLREQRALPLVDVLARDVGLALRQMRRSWRFTASAALTLALGIGATTAVVAVLQAVVLRPIPYAEPDRLVALRSLDRRGGGRPTQLSYPTFFDFREQNQVFERLVSYRDAPFTLTDAHPPLQVAGEIVSWDLFPLLGIAPERGRGFRPEEERPGTHVVVLSHALWESRFGGDGNIVGRAVPLNGALFTVVGVAPRGFQFPVDVPGVQLWVTVSQDEGAHHERGGRMIDAIGRLKSGVSVEQARARMDIVAGALARQYPDSNANIATTWIQPELKRIAGGSETPILVLLGAVTLVLLIACANVAGLLLARSTDRAREFALRTALGASRGALLRQLLVESLGLGMLGTAAGVLMAMGALKAILPLAGDLVPRLGDAAVDGETLAFSAALAVLTSVLFGLAPALQAAGVEPAVRLKEGTCGIAPGHDRFRSALVVGQIALGLVLFAGAEVLTAGFVSLMQRDPGFRTDHLLTFDVGSSESHDTVAGRIAFCDLLVEAMRAIPGVEAAATGTPLPLQGHEMRAAFDIELRPAAASNRPRSDFAIVTPQFFAAMGIPLLQGRDFTEGDDVGRPAVLVVNQAFARRFFPGEEVIGKRMKPGLGAPPAPLREIVGVVGDARQGGLGAEADPIYYLPYKQLPWGIGTVVLRTAVPPSEVVSAARAALARLDRRVPMSRVRTGEGLSAAVVAPVRFLTVLMAYFAAIALLLTVVGLYGVLSYLVAKRQREIGVRMALGANRGEVIGIVGRHAASLVTAGLILGSAGAMGVGRLLGSGLAGGPGGMPIVVAGACAVMAIASAVETLRSE